MTRRGWATALAALALIAGASGAAAQGDETPSPSGVAWVVNSAGDAPDAAPGDGVCDTGMRATDGTPECTLRAAIAEAGARPGPDYVRVAPPSWQQDVTGVRMTPATPYPDVPERLVIDAAGVVSGSVFDRGVVIDAAAIEGAPVISAVEPVLLRGLTVENGVAAGPVTVVGSLEPDVPQDPAATAAPRLPQPPTRRPRRRPRRRRPPSRLPCPPRQRRRPQGRRYPR